MNPNDTETSTIISAKMPVALRDELVRLAGRHDRSMSAEVRAAVREYISRADEGFSAGAPAAMASTSPSPGRSAVPAGAGVQLGGADA